MRARAIMVQGTSSWAGKSLLTTVLCRHFARQGLRVAPFKAQNMSNNARVVAGGEIGTAQYLQAVAARATPDVRMNPVLIKPESPTSSQVVIRGVADAALSEVPWRDRPTRLWSAITESYAALADEFELLVIEGAGSPAEINLRDTDLANMATARLADSPVLLVADIDRGGALAHLYGTWALVAEPDRPRIRAFVLNRFRGDLALLDPAPQQLRQLTGVPTLGVVPMLAHGLPDEDGAAPHAGRVDGVPVAIVRYPTASNLDELTPLRDVAAITWAEHPADLDGAELVILPGSKQVQCDLAWLRSAGLEASIRAHVAGGRRLLGICGGLQMLGERVGDVDGLGLLALRTSYAEVKRLASVSDCTFASLQGPWSSLSGVAAGGYEIRNGHSVSCGEVGVALDGGLGWVSGPVLGVYLHGLFEQADVVRGVFGAAPGPGLDSAIDALTDQVMAALDERLLGELAEGR